MATKCILWKKITPNGYGYLHEGAQFYLAHRYFYEKKYGKIKKGLQIDHLCRIKHCVNTDHMEVVTPAENSRRRLNSKINMKQAIEIRKIYKEKLLTQAGIAVLYSIGQDEVSRIVNNRRWA